MTIEDGIEWDDDDDDDTLAITVIVALTASCAVMKEYMDKNHLSHPQMSCLRWLLPWGCDSQQDVSDHHRI